MIEPTVTLSRAFAAAGWAIATFLMIGSWVMTLLSWHGTAVALGQTAILFSAAAATLTVRGWFCRTCQLMRATYRDSLPDEVSRLR